MPVYAADFRAGNLISDGNFYNGSALTETGVQDLLENKVPICPSGSKCLPDFVQTTTDRAADANCAAYPGGFLQTAAHIIAQVGLTCGVSQKVLLALIQKESTLVTNSGPTAGDYSRATGYACPDTSSCNPVYAGFFKQVHAAAWQFKEYLSTPSARFAVGEATHIDYHPDATRNCGGSDVTIVNNATAALYRYTPFQPNAAAVNKNNFFVDGDDCSSVGNRNFWSVYNGWFGSSTVDRLAGTDRFAASADISARNFAPGTQTVYVTSGVNFPDALSGAPVAARERAPILLVLPDKIPTSIGAELQRLQPDRIIILGGPNSVSDGVERALGNYAAAPVERLDGAGRFSASADISAQSFPVGVAVAYVTNGYNFPDALSGAPVAAENSGPVLLVQPGDIPQSIWAELDRLNPRDIVVLGGINSVSTKVETDLATLTAGAVQRFDGVDRFSASANISAQNFAAPADTVYVANGLNFPDALSGAPVAALHGSPVLLVAPNSLPTAIRAEIDRLSPRRIVVLGGVNSVSAPVVQDLARLIR
jgi:putative cell wall-binding protein